MANEYQPWEPLYYLTHDGIEGDAEFYRDFLSLRYSRRFADDLGCIQLDCRSLGLRGYLRLFLEFQNKNNSQNSGD